MPRVLLAGPLNSLKFAALINVSVIAGEDRRVSSRSGWWIKPV
jgi:hypothetical protein